MVLLKIRYSGVREGILEEKGEAEALEAEAGKVKTKEGTCRLRE